MFFRKLKLDIKPKITLEHGQADRQTSKPGDRFTKYLTIYRKTIVNLTDYLTDGRSETNARNDGKQEGTERLM